MHRIFCSVGLLWLVAASLPACARHMNHDPLERFAQADSNHDGLVGRQEFLAARAARFEQMDRDRDGYLADSDMPRFMRSDAGRMRKFHAAQQMADSDGDGRISHAEFIAAGARMFALVDANHDQVIDKAELQQATDRLGALASAGGVP